MARNAVSQDWKSRKTQVCETGRIMKFGSVFQDVVTLYIIILDVTYICSSCQFHATKHLSKPHQKRKCVQVGSFKPTCYCRHPFKYHFLPVDPVAVYYNDSCSPCRRCSPQRKAHIIRRQPDQVFLNLCPFNSPLIRSLYFSYSTSSTDWRAKYNEVNPLLITI